jgi:hypothetical protein
VHDPLWTPKFAFNALNSKLKKQFSNSSAIYGIKQEINKLDEFISDITKTLLFHVFFNYIQSICNWNGKIANL